MFRRPYQHLRSRVVEAAASGPPRRLDSLDLGRVLHAVARGVADVEEVIIVGIELQSYYVAKSRMGSARFLQPDQLQRLLTQSTRLAEIVSVPVQVGPVDDLGGEEDVAFGRGNLDCQEVTLPISTDPSIFFFF